MIIAHKIALDPNNAQETFFRKSAGCARFAFNWGLEQWQAQYQAGQTPSEGALRRHLNAIKAEHYPFLLEVPKTVIQQAIKNLGTAFTRFFENVREGRRVGPKHNPFGYPQFKKRGFHDSFRIDNGPPEAGRDAVKVDGKRLYVPKLGWVRMREAVRVEGQIKSAVVSCTAGRWFVSLAVELGDLVSVRKNHATVGVDLGVKALATLSTGEQVEGPKPLRKLLKKLARLQRKLARAVKGSANRKKLKARVARLHARIANIRQDALHKLTSDLAGRFSLIGIEDLNVKGMLKNSRLSRSIADMGFGEFRRQIEYKAQRAGARVFVVGRFTPTSKACSGCGTIKDDLTLAERVFECDCGLVLDRDLNAARTIAMLAASSAVSA